MSSNSSVIKTVKLINDSDREIFDIIIYGVIASLISLFGVVANVMNVVVFYKQGFSNTMNISFFGLAISDLFGLLTLIGCGVLSNPMLGLPVVSSDVIYMTQGSPHCIFARITGWITVYVTAERCLCITFPLKIKQIVTPTKTLVIICCIFLVMVASFLPEFLTTYLDWKFYPERNRTLIGMSFTQSRKSLEGLMFILYFLLGLASFFVVIVFTVILVVQLKRKSKWRKTANADKLVSDTLSIRDKKAMNMVAMIATVLIVCYTPGVLASVVSFSEPEIKIDGVDVNAFFVIWGIVFVFDATNSSVNIFLYYKMSSKFRETFNQTFSVTCPQIKSCK